MNDGPEIDAKCVVGESLSVVGGQLPIAAITARTGLSCRRGNVPFVDVGKLRFICVSAMASGLNGQTPVAENAALIVSSVKAHRYVHPNMPAKSAFMTWVLCKSSNCWISYRNSFFIFAKQTTSSPWRT